MIEVIQIYYVKGFLVWFVLLILCGFLVFVILEQDIDNICCVFFFVYDIDSFNCWEVGCDLVCDVLLDMIENDVVLSVFYFDSLCKVFVDDILDFVYCVYLQVQFVEFDFVCILVVKGVILDFDKIYVVMKVFKQVKVDVLKDFLCLIYDVNQIDGLFVLDVEGLGKCVLVNSVLFLIINLDDGILVQFQFEMVDNMIQ